MQPNDITGLPVEERGPWLATSQGKMWSLEHPHTRDVDLRDIAAGLSRQCRYGGQIKDGFEFYSVCEHSIFMTIWAMKSEIVETREDALAILLHDASEAFFGDMPSPLKALMPEYKRLETQAQDVIIDAFGLPGNTLVEKSQIKEIDVRIRFNERMTFSENPAGYIALDDDRELYPGTDPLDLNLWGLTPGESRMLFLQCVSKVCEKMPNRNPENDALHAELVSADIIDDVEHWLCRAETAEARRFTCISDEFTQAIECCQDLQHSEALSM
jgi:hypothetical protein